MTYFDNDNVTTSVDIGIPDEMWFRARNFEVGDSVKVRVFLGYWHGCRRLQIMAGLTEEVTSVKIIVK